MKPSSKFPLHITISGNKLKSKFERMEQSQKFNFLTKLYRFVASLPDRYFPDTVLLFKPRMRHPALRVTAIRKYFENKRFFCTIIEENDENLEKNRIFQFFQFYHFFYEIMQTFVRIFTLAKMNRI